MTDDPREVNWQKEYLHQINARLDGLQDGHRRLDEKMERGFTLVRADLTRLDEKMERGFARQDDKMEAGFHRQDTKMEELAGRFQAEVGRLDAKIDEGIARLDGKIDRGLREVRRLQWGTLALIATATLGTLARSLL